MKDLPQEKDQQFINHKENSSDTKVVAIFFKDSQFKKISPEDAIISTPPKDNSLWLVKLIRFL